MKIAAMKTSLKNNLEWFIKSGIMSPSDGSWGVGERICLTDQNEALEQTFKSFPAYIKYDGYAILEHRRPDCNFETALMFLLASEVFGQDEYFRIADNILTYLYWKSGMGNFSEKYPEFPQCAWKWSHDGWRNVIYFDDNAWNCVIPLIIANLNPELDRKFELRSKSMVLAEQMEDAFNQQFGCENANVAKISWAGSLESPHWGSLAVMAFAFAYAETQDEKYKRAILRYNEYLDANQDKFTASEYAYTVIGASAAVAVMDSAELRNSLNKFAERLISKMDQVTGNISSEWGNEAPTGDNLVDLIYTQNWALLGLQAFCAVEPKKRHLEVFYKALKLVMRIQDVSGKPQFNGCWRGMYDLTAAQWGGGDRYEGGAGSIYSGWTNAPISIVMASELLQKSLLTDRCR